MIRKTIQYIAMVVQVIFICGGAIAQKNIEGLIQAERNFAAYSVKNGTRPAFLAFADSNSIMFDKGKPVNGLQLWKARGNSKGVLDWQPDYAEIAASGDFGYSTGPWAFYNNSRQDTPVSQGHFVTVWHIGPEGSWKFLIDLGIGYPKPSTSFSLQRILPAGSGGSQAVFEDVMQAERAFLDAYEQYGGGAYSRFLSSRSRLYRNNFGPASDPAGKKRLLDSLPAGLAYTVNGGGIAPSGDLAYVYGSIIFKGRNENYMRIWRREQNGWKIALEVVRY